MVDVSQRAGPASSIGGAGAAPHRVLVVDDDATVAEVVLSYLRKAGIAAAHTADGRSALIVAINDPPDLVVLDLMLPGMGGFQVCRRLREVHPELPIVMLTAMGEETDRIAGLELGADDYVTKPFSPRELVLRVESVLRRAVASDTGSVLSDGDLQVDLQRHTASRSGQALQLTNREFDLLGFFLANPGRVYSRDELLSAVWGWDVGDRSTVTVHVRRLREKVESNQAAPTRLVTVWGLGYRWDRSSS